MHGTRCAPARSHLAGCWPGAVCLETSARKEPPVNDLVNLDIRTYKYLQRKLLEGLHASGAALPARYPASEHRWLPAVLCLRLANAGAAQHRSPTCTVGYCLHSWDKHRPAWSQPNPYGKPAGDSGERGSQGGTRHGNARGSSGEPVCIAALEPALVPCKLPVPMCILFQTNIKNSYFYLKQPCQALAPESGRISKENRRIDSLQALVVQPYVRIPSPRLLLPCMGISSSHHEKKTYKDIVDPQGVFPRLDFLATSWGCSTAANTRWAGGSPAAGFAGCQHPA